MLTLEKMEAYQHFGGDLDGWTRARPLGDRSGITPEDWRLIAELLQALHLVVSGQAAPDFRAATENSLIAHVADGRTRHLLRSLVSRDFAPHPLPARPGS